MNKAKPTLLILAAGMGSRYGGLKQVDGVGPNDEAIIEYSIFDAIKAGFGKVVFVIRRDIEQAFKEKIGSQFENRIPVEYVFQERDSFVPAPFLRPDREKPWGTSHAVLVAKDAIQEPFAVINADDYYGVDSFKLMADFLVNECSPSLYCVIAYILRNTLSDHGTVNRGVCSVDEEGYLKTITERLKIRWDGPKNAQYEANEALYDLSPESLVSMNMLGFHPAVFDVLSSEFHAFLEKEADNPKSEFLIPSVMQHQIDDQTAKVKVIPSNDSWYGVTYREDKPMVQDAFAKLVSSGVYNSPLWEE